MSQSAVTTVFQVFTVLALVLINGFFVAAEFSLVRVRRSRIEELINAGQRRARLVDDILKDLDTVISSTQLGITMASLALGWVGEPFLAHLIEPWLSFLPSTAGFITAHAIAVIASFALITYLHIVLGEVAPKTLALQRTEETALSVAWPMIIFTRLFRPFIRFLNASGALVLRLLGVRGHSREHLLHTEEELRIILSDSQQGGVLEENETEIIQRVFDFTDLTARQVMVPRTDMVCIPVDAALDEVLETVTSHPFTRFPVYRDGVDDIVGIVQVRDLLPVTCSQPETFDLSTLLRKPLIAPEMIQVNDLLDEFRRNKTHLAILVDEFGGTAGLVTLQDLLEEIVGDLSDSLEGDELGIEPQDDGSTLVNGRVLLGDVNNRFGLALEDPHYVTIGGFVFSRIGRRPRLNDDVAVNGAVLRVEALDGLRVRQVRLVPTVAEQGDGESTYDDAAQA
jgi:CBS domain containing-hemolysin-like protein